MKVKFIPNIIGSPGTVSKEYIQGMEDLEIRGRVRQSQLQHC